MNARERILTTLNHQEPDRIPFDMGSNQVTGIHHVAYRRLREALGLPPTKPDMVDVIQQLARPEPDVVEALGLDVRGLFPLNSHNWAGSGPIQPEDGGDVWIYRDEWGITHHRLKPDGLYYSMVEVPLPDPDVTVQDVENHAWPEVGHPDRLAGLRERAEAYRAAGYAVMLKDAFAGIFEMSQRIVGMEHCLMFMVTKPAVMEAVFDKLLELKLSYWQTALSELGDVIDIISYADDYGTQVSQLISPAMFRQMVKPRLVTLFDTFERLAPQVKRFFHSDGNIRPLLPDFAQLGVDILNPVQFTATGMDLAPLKQAYGRDFVFWGAGIDTQTTLPRATPAEVKDEVRRNIEILAPGGGYVFNTIHNIQADVPPENIIAMWEALQEYGLYTGERTVPLASEAVPPATPTPAVAPPVEAAPAEADPHLESILDEVYEAIVRGQVPATREAVQTALDEGVSAPEVLQEACIPAMDEVGHQFECGEKFVPEMLVAAHAMQAAVDRLRPHLVEAAVEAVGTVVLGTVAGDIHDIGKNLVGMMLEGAGFTVVDLGVNIAPAQFIEAIEAHQPQVVGLSALLTTTMPEMGTVIKALTEAGVREQVRVMVGGAPVTEDYARQIGADGFAPNAGRAAQLAKGWVA